MAPATKPRHSTAPLGLPGSAITSELSTMAARLRERIAFGVIFIDSARMGIDATGKLPGENYHRPWPELLKMNARVRALVDSLRKT